MVHCVDIFIIYSSVDMATHSTLSVISNEAFTSEVSINPGCHGDNSTEDEVESHMISITLNSNITGC